MEINFCYFNERWNIYINHEEVNFKELEESFHVKLYGGQATANLRKLLCDIPIYSFGILYVDESRRPGHKGEWSSRCSLMNKIFGCDLIECAINQIAASVDKKWFKEATKSLGLTWRQPKQLSDGEIPVEEISDIIGFKNRQFTWAKFKNVPLPQLVK